MTCLYSLQTGHTATSHMVTVVALHGAQSLRRFMTHPTGSNKNLHNNAFSIFEGQVKTQKESLGTTTVLDQIADLSMANTIKSSSVSFYPHRTTDHYKPPQTSTPVTSKTLFSHVSRQACHITKHSKYIDVKFTATEPLSWPTSIIRVEAIKKYCTDSRREGKCYIQ